MNKRVDGGSAIVEFAIVMPLILFILFATIEFGLIIFDWQLITNGSREGARYGTLYQSTRPTAQAIADRVERATAQLVSFGADTTPTVAVARRAFDSDTDTWEASWTDVTGTNAGCVNFRDQLRVTVSFDYEFLVLGALWRALHLFGRESDDGFVSPERQGIGARAVMLCE
ncbi:TadE/TadG family type IV pilus assembly protein [Thiohalocapsa marina]|nr:TadE/TadG family type IV pilus assembly protein [Thiohalocapsa marina]